LRDDDDLAGMDDRGESAFKSKSYTDPVIHDHPTQHLVFPFNNPQPYQYSEPVKMNGYLILHPVASKYRCCFCQRESVRCFGARMVI